MTKSDPAILELFEESGLTMPPAVVSYNVDGVSHVTVKRRLRELENHGLLEKAEDKRGYYRITDRGRAYLSGDIESHELENKE